MIKLIAIKLIDLFSNIFQKDKEIEFSEAIKLEWTYYTTPSIESMKNYKKPHVGQKFFCMDTGEMYVYVGGRKFVCMTNVYI